jgi:saccharopine dehydrogenase-like NADP-dependent oxidoreductase
MAIERILVLGLGKVGTLVATLLHQGGYRTTGADHIQHSNLPFDCEKADISDKKTLLGLLKKHDAVVSCLPYHLNLYVATCAFETGTHYFDLTEDTATTSAIRQMAPKSKGIMAPQCGLAPGFIGIIGAYLAQAFSTIRSIELRVGALPQHPKGNLGYAFNWSAEGVVNEYLNDCQSISEGQIKMVPPMQDVETIIIHGRTLEAFTTSGGIGTFCETFAGKTDELNYKTMRYPGHLRLMRFFFHELRMKKDRELAGTILVNAKPPVDDDVVYIHAAVEGNIKENDRLVLRRKEFVRAYYPLTIEGQQWRAISWTTAASVVGVVEMASRGILPQRGFIKQEDIPFTDFIKTKTGCFYEDHQARL